MRTIISLGLFKETGGPTKTIGAFKQALDANLYCFCGKAELSAGSLAVDGACAVEGVSTPILKQLVYSTTRYTQQAEIAVSKSSIISCHSFYRYHALWTNAIARKYNIPYWFVPHGILDPWVMQNSTIQKRLFWATGGRRFLDEAATVIFSTSTEFEKASAQFDLPASEVIPWPVEFVDCSDRGRRRSGVREKLGIDEEAKILLYFGRLHTMKKPLETIRAFAAGGDENLHLMMLGNEQDVSLKDCYEIARESGVHDRVHLVGPVYGNEKYDYLLAADAYISLSHRENFNHSAAECLSAGLPLILSRGNDLQGDLVEEECTWGLCDDSPETASKAVEEFNNLSIEKLQQMGARGREWVLRNLQYNKFAERIIAVANKFGK